MSRRANHQGSVTFDTSKQRYRARLDGRSKLFVTRTEADDQLRDWLNERDEGMPSVRNKQTLLEYLVHWLDRRVVRKEIAVTTAQTYDCYIRGRIGTHPIGKRTLDADGWPQAIDEFLTDLLRAGLASASVRQIHTILRKALGDARRARLVGYNPATREHVDTVTVVDKPAQVLTLEQSTRLAQTFPGHRYADLFMFLLATGCRLGEARGLRWHDDDGTPLVDLESGTVLLGVRTIITLKGKWLKARGRNWDWKELTKTNQIVPLVLSQQGLAAVRAQEHHIKVVKMACPPTLWQDLDLVFPSAVGSPFDATNANHEWHKLCERAGVPHVSLHSARHTSATNDLRAGTDPRVVQAKHGWKSGKMLERYQHVDLDLLRQAAQRSEAYLPAWREAAQ